MRTMSFGCDTIDEVVLQLDNAFWADGKTIMLTIIVVTISRLLKFLIRFNESYKTRLVIDWRTAGNSWPQYIRPRL
jgi:hypothetical protein